MSEPVDAEPDSDAPSGRAFRLERRVDRWLEAWWRISPRGRPELRTTLTVLAGSGVALLGSFLTRVLMARALSPAELGLLLLAIAIVTPLGGALSLGLAQAAALTIAERRAAGDLSGARAAGGSALLLSLGAGLIGCLALVVAAPALAGRFADAAGAPTLRALLWAVAPVVVSLPVGLATMGVHRGFGGATARAVLRDGGGGVARTLGVALAALAGGGAQALAVGFSLGVVISDGAYAAYGVVRGWAARVRRVDAELWSRVLGLAPLSLVNELRRWSDVLAVGLVLDARAVGLYGLARGFGRVLEAIQQAPLHSFLPTASTLDDHALRPIHRRVRDITLAIAWVPAAVCLLAPQWVVVPLAGEAYREAAPLLGWLAAAVLVDITWGFNQQVLLARRGERVVLAASLATVVVTVALVLTLAPRWGVVGAAAALTAAESLRVLALALLLRARGYRQPALRVSGLLALGVLAAGAWWLWRDRPGEPASAAVALAVIVGGALTLGLGVLRAGRTDDDG